MSASQRGRVGARARLWCAPKIRFATTVDLPYQNSQRHMAAPTGCALSQK
jgi:hypothetical protein